ncbi:YicC family protein [Kyrpidia spormannii]|uniref:YicC family protein n=1 Tax=Kyrpidia spormannii TaxID=2055160 RepID=A0A2K8N9J5_9BACL|nr:YicC/YloC family endoribonuclease [Kyrpidia spormannii]ATY85102.1 YicC family protein [Kyrpidia spormannii]
MLKSMTGYGRGTGHGAGYTVGVEIRSVNHRFREIAIRGPREWLALEDDFRRAVAREISRGRVDVYISALPDPTVGDPAILDIALARAVKKAGDALAADLGFPDGISLRDILAIPGVVRPQEAAVDPEVARPVVQRALDAALRMLAAARRREGERLEEDARHRFSHLSRLVEEIGLLAAEVPKEYRRRLEEKMQEWNLPGVVDAGRIAVEVAMLADRASIEEEIVRLSSHLGQFEAALGSREAVGRRLDFLLQEMFREFNTIGAKAGSAEIALRVVDAKTVLEQLREQVQNVE